MEGGNCYQCSTGDDGCQVTSCPDDDGCGKGSFFRFLCTQCLVWSLNIWFHHSERTESYFEFSGCCEAISEAGPFHKNFLTDLICTRQEDFDEDGGFMNKDVNTCCCKGDLWVLFFFWENDQIIISLFY